MKTQSQFHIVGTVLVVGSTQTFASGFTKRQLVIETSSNPDQWSRPVAVTLAKDKVSLADNLAVGTEVQVEGFVDGRSWKKDAQAEVKFFTDLTVRSLLTVGAESQTQEPSAETATAEADANALPDEMPF